MTRSYLTEIGMKGTGETGNRTPGQAMKLIHDIFRRAAKEELDVSMLAGSLRASVRDELYKEVTGVTFDRSIEEVLEAGRSVRILLWSEPRKGLISDRIKRLIKKCESREFNTKLDVRITGRHDHADKVPHFTVAHRDNRWLLRVEEPHAFRTDLAEKLEAEGSPIPAAIIFDDDKARKHAEPLLTLFNEWFDEVPENCPVSSV